MKQLCAAGARELTSQMYSMYTVHA